MCTVSAISFGKGFRLVCNRDELLIRPIALPPVFRQFGERDAMLPIDPQSGGTWIAVNDAGVAMSLLNVNAGRQRGAYAGRCSRGEIIPSLLHCGDVAQAVEAVWELHPLHFPPFRLVILDATTWAEALSDGWNIRITARPFDGAPRMLTSSGLGDAIVEHARRELFDCMIRTADASPQRQDAFHAHRWPARPEISVMMQRAGARTVSRTIIEVSADHARLTYVADGRQHIANLRVRQLQTA